MPEYLAPGVFVEETSFRSRDIQGVSTSTAAFVGPAHEGPEDGEPAMLTSFREFERLFGGMDDLEFAGERVTHFLAFGAKYYFANGGRRLYVARTDTAAGDEPSSLDYVQALDKLRELDDIATVAAPGYSILPEHQAIEAALVSHAEELRRFAVLDAQPNRSVSEAIEDRETADSSHAALYYPWLVVPVSRGYRRDPNSEQRISLPPSAFICGVFASNDARFGAHSSPANIPLRGTIDLSQKLSNLDLERLNIAHVNAIRNIPGGRSLRVWGARTLSSDPEWRYISVRRYINYLRESIERGLNFAVFEPNSERLWNQAHTAVSTFLNMQFRAGALQGTTASQAFFVRCDHSTMSQVDIDSGLLVLEFGVAMIRPAEFVFSRISAQTRAS